MANVAIFLIKVYQKTISKHILKGSNCRFYPTCSAYSILAYTKHGFIKGSYLTIRRIFKCHPFHKGGYDPLK